MLAATLALALSSLQMVAAGHALRQTRLDATGVVKGLHFKHRLRVCNAYPDAEALDVYSGEDEKLTSDEALAYNRCGEFRAPLTAGDRIDFKFGSMTAGSFAVADLPKYDAILLLVIHRHDLLSTAVSFESHIFASLLNAQVAVIDTYKGNRTASVRIMDAQGSGQSSRSEELRFDSVVAVNPGRYEVEFENQNGEATTKGELVAVNRESYIVLRTGLEATNGKSFPQEIVVFPKSDPAQLESSARAARPLAVVLLPVFMSIVTAAMGVA